jgi:hypothetical protein
MKRTISQENMLSGSKRKFPFVVWTQVWPERSTKVAKRLKIGFSAQETFNRSIKVNDLGWNQVDKESGCEKGFIPKLKRHGGISKQGKTYFNNVPMFVFCITILLMCMGSIYMMRNAHFSKDHIHHPN